MAFVSGFEHDIFVSYAKVDDVPVTDVELGWVSTMTNNLEIRLRQLFGRCDAFSLWMDRDLSGHRPLHDQLVQKVERSATLLVVSSPAYLSSEWCKRELERFLETAAARGHSQTSIFLVDRDPVDREQRPKELVDLLGYQFWEDRNGKGPRILGHPKPTPGDVAYYCKLEDLARAIHKELSRRVDVVDVVEADTSERSSSVYVAEVTDDLDPMRDAVIRYLDQRGHRILPEAWYSRDANAFRQSVAQDMAECSAFVQLLGELPGKHPRDCDQTYVQLQHQQAVALGKPILQWRSPRLDPADVADEAHRSLLTSDCVLKVDIEEFKREIARQLDVEATTTVDAVSQDAFVFVDVRHEDRDQADRICETLDDLGYAYALPILEGSPRQIRTDLEENLLDCDGLIVVYGNITPSWVREQLRLWRKIIYRRERPLRALAVYEGPPESKAPLDLRLPKMLVIDCRKGLEAEHLKPFFDSLTT